MGGIQSAPDLVVGYEKSPDLALINLTGQCYGILSPHIKLVSCSCERSECPTYSDCNVYILLKLGDGRLYKFPVQIYKDDRPESGLFSASIHLSTAVEIPLSSQQGIKID